jgi:hypothetical protein
MRRTGALVACTMLVAAPAATAGCLAGLKSRS